MGDRWQQAVINIAAEMENEFYNYICQLYQF